MARLFDDANEEYFVLGSAILTTAPMTVFARINTDQASQQQIIFSICTNSTVNDTWWLEITSGNTIDWIARTSSNARATSTTTVSTNTWYDVFGVERAANDRSVLINNGSEGTNTTSRSPAPNRTCIGLRRPNQPANPFSGMMAYVVVWNVALDANERASAMVHPFRTRRSAIRGYYPLESRTGNAIDYSGQGNDMTDTNTVGVATENPPAQPPFGIARRTMITVPSVVVADEEVLHRPKLAESLVLGHLTG